MEKFNIEMHLFQQYYAPNYDDASITLGHAQVETTMNIYSHVSNDDKKIAAGIAQAYIEKIFGA